MVYPLTFQQHLNLLRSLYCSGNTRLAEQLALHLSYSIHIDLMYPVFAMGIPVALVSAEKLLINTMQDIGMM